MQTFPLNLPSPAFIAPPSPTKPKWIFRSDTKGRSERRKVSAARFEQIKDEHFSDKLVLDQIIGVAAQALIARLLPSAAKGLGLGFPRDARG